MNRPEVHAADESALAIEHGDFERHVAAVDHRRRGVPRRLGHLVAERGGGRPRGGGGVGGGG